MGASSCRILWATIKGSDIFQDEDGFLWMLCGNWIVRSKSGGSKMSFGPRENDGLGLGAGLARGEQIPTKFPRPGQQGLPMGPMCRVQKRKELRLTLQVEAWAPGWMVMPHGRGRGLGQNQEFCSGVQSRSSLSTLLHCLPKVNKVQTYTWSYYCPVGSLSGW